MLGGVLDGGTSARMESNLVRGQRLAAGLGAGYDGLQRGNGTFTITATPNPAVSLDQLEAAIKRRSRRSPSSRPARRKWTGYGPGCWRSRSISATR